MKITKAEFIRSYVNVKEIPTDKPQYAFIGRSNVGKSSLINMILDRKNLAKTSSKPGKTQTLNLFEVNDSWYIVDLPGYGYAKTGKINREVFSELISDYILKSKDLMTVFVLIDSRIPPQKSDLEFILNIGINKIPLIIVYTKTDKLSKNKVAANISAFKKKMSENWTELPVFINTSAETRLGQTEILDFIEKTNLLYKK